MYQAIVVVIAVQVGVLVYVHVVHVSNGSVLVHVGYGFVVFFHSSSVFSVYQLVYSHNYLVSTHVFRLFSLSC